VGRLGEASACPHHRTTFTFAAAMPISPERRLPLLLLACSNHFMTFGW
jgi:hypothetical protein